MRTTPQREIEAILELDGPARFAHFVKRVVDEEQAWGLWQDGWALGADDTGAPVFPLWPAPEYAELCRTKEWEGYHPKGIPLQDLLETLAPSLEQQKVRPGVFPTPGGKWVTPTVEELCSSLRRELESYT